MALREEVSFGDWLRSMCDRGDVAPSSLYRLYVRKGGERSERTWRNWVNDQNFPDLPDLARIVRALEEALPEVPVRTELDQLMRRFERTPRRAGVVAA